MKIVSAKRVLLIILIALGISIVILNHFSSASFDVQHSWLGIIVVVFFGAALFTLSQSGINNASSKLYFSFFIVFGLFHLGVPLGAAIGEFGEEAASYIDLWYFTEHTYKALMAVFVFMVGYLVAFIVPLRINKAGMPNIFILRSLHFDYGSRILTILVFLWILVVKLYFDVDTYTEYYEFADNALLKFVYTYFNGLIGFLFVLLCFSEEYRKKAIFMFLLWAIFAFPMGLRGGVLFPLAIAIPILVNKKVIKITAARAVVGVFFLLLLISLVFNYRGHGEIVEGAVISPVGAIVEMGGSLRPVHEVLKWHGMGETDLLMGQSYWAPFERTISKFVPFYSVPDAFDDDRLMNVLIVKKAGPYGFSIAAEAYINFGFFGVLMIGFGAGMLLMWLDLRLASLMVLQYSFIDICVVTSLFFHIRQSFVGAFGAFAIGFALCVLLSFIYKVKNKYKLERR